MYFDNISSNNKLHNQTVHPIILRENQGIHTESQTTTHIINKPDSNVFTFFFWITFLSVISLVLVTVFQKLVRVKVRGLSILPVSQIPCRNCKFFAQNQYLKCAVRPFTVLTAQAADCSDYCGKHESYWQTDCAGEVKHGSLMECNTMKCKAGQAFWGCER